MGHLDELFARSSIPGFSNIATFSSHRAQLCWILVILASFVGFTVHVAVLVFRYNQKEIVTETVLNSMPVVFPDVTICNKFPLNYHRTKAKFNRTTAVDGNDTAKLVEATGDDLLHQIKNFWKAALHMDAEIFGEYSRTDNIYTRKSLERFTTTNKLAHNLDELVLKCHYNRKPCNPTDFKEFVFPLYQRCWTFSPPNRNISETNPDNGLRLMIHLGDRRALLSDDEILNWMRGIAVLIHDPGTAPVINQGVIIAAVGKYTSIEFETTQSIRKHTFNSPCISQVNSHQKSENFVWINQANEIAATARYSYSKPMCEEMARQQLFIDQCNCYAEDYMVTQRGVTENPTRQYCHQLSDRILWEPSYFRMNGGSNNPEVMVNYTLTNPGAMEGSLAAPTNLLTTQPNPHDNTNRTDQSTNTNDSSSTSADNSLTNSTNQNFPKNDNNNNNKHQLANAVKTVKFSVWNKDEVNAVTARQQCYNRVQSLIQEDQNHLNMTQCPNRCTRHSYISYTTAYDWPESVTNAQNALVNYLNEGMATMQDPLTYKTSLDKYVSKLDKIRFAFLRTDLYAKSKLGTQIVESYAYPFSAFFSDFGGILGFWLGMSIITIVEIISSCITIYKKTRLSQTERLEDDQNRQSKLSSLGTKSNSAKSSFR